LQVWPLLARALAAQRPEILNTDQGVQYTSAAFQTPRVAAQVRLSLDGRGRAFDNIVVERLWRTVKYEEVFIKDYRDVAEAHQGLDQYLNFYNNERIHQALDYRTPKSVPFAR
jgi:putative transposase